MFPIFVCIVALIAKVLFFLLAWSVSHTIYLIEEKYNSDFKNAEFNGRETLESIGRDC